MSWCGRRPATPGRPRCWPPSSPRSPGLLPLLLPGHVRVALLDRHVLALGEVADLDDAALDRDLGAVAGVLGEPLGAADGRRRATALGAEAPVAVAPQAPDLLPLPGRRRLAGPAAAQRAVQLQLGDRLAALGLRDLELALVEVRRLRLAATGRRRQPHPALGRVDGAPQRDRLVRPQRPELPVPEPDPDRAGDLADHHRLALHGLGWFDH